MNFRSMIGTVQKSEQNAEKNECRIYVKERETIMKKSMKIMSAAMSGIMVLSLAACGGSDVGTTAAKDTTEAASEAKDSTDTQAAQEEKADGEAYTVGICQLVQHDALDAATEGFKDAITEALGADAVTFDEQNAQGDSNTCSTIINNFVSNDVDLILANATAALQAAAAGTEDIPVLGTAVTEYGVALDLDDFDGTVGTNISGTSDLAPLDQQAAMLNELFPDAKNVGLLYCSAEPNSQYQVDTVKEELEKLGYTCEYYAFSDSNDLSSVVTTAASESDVIYVPTDNTAASNAEIINNICLPEKVPVIAGEEGICSGCGVATLSISYYDLGTATGKMAVKILKGEEDVAEMPVEYAPNFTKKYNPEICEELGLEIPDDYEAIAAEE